MSRSKRNLDIVLGVVALLLIWPLLLLIAVAVKAQDRGNVFFRQQRIGRYGRPFYMWKFRTMVQEAGTLGPALTVGCDGRITRVGAWLRRHKLDELPQLVNVVFGEMTLVGPRPEIPRYVAVYTRDQRSVLDLAPGITDRASLTFADESALLGEASDPESFYVDRLLPEKIRINLEYARRATLLTDLGVILKTIAYVVMPSGRRGIR